MHSPLEALEDLDEDLPGDIRTDPCMRCQRQGTPRFPSLARRAGLPSLCLSTLALTRTTQPMGRSAAQRPASSSTSATASAQRSAASASTSGSSSSSLLRSTTSASPVERMSQLFTLPPPNTSGERRVLRPCPPWGTGVLHRIRLIPGRSGSQPRAYQRSDQRAVASQRQPQRSGVQRSAASASTTCSKTAGAVGSAGTPDQRQGGLHPA